MLVIENGTCQSGCVPPETQQHGSMSVFPAELHTAWKYLDISWVESAVLRVRRHRFRHVSCRTSGKDDMLARLARCLPKSRPGPATTRDQPHSAPVSRDHYGQKETMIRARTKAVVTQAVHQVASDIREHEHVSSSQVRYRYCLITWRCVMSPVSPPKADD